jgi:TolB-like protein/Flp pilus assembly protein TadD
MMGEEGDNRLGRLWRELRRRRVVNSAGLYLAACWLILQVFDVVMVPVGLPEWVMKLAVWLSLVGFPLVLLLSWRYEFSAGGIRRTPPESPPPDADLSIKRFDYLVIGFMIVFGVFVSASLTRILDRETGRSPAIEVTADSIAVLPFENMSGDAADEYLGRGLAEDILHRLAMVEGLKVASRTASFDLDTTDLDIATIAGRLGVESVLEGSVRKSGNRLRVVAQLIDANSGFHIWSRSYDRDMSDLFGIYDEISNAVVKELQLTLAPEAPLFVVPPTRDMEAYDYYLQARSILQRSTRAESSADAQRFFAKAVERDPGFAEAWAGQCLAYLDWYYYQPTVDKMDQARTSCQTAVELAPDMAEGHAALGDLHRKTGNYPSAIAEYQSALQADQNNALAWRGLGQALAELEQEGDAEDAMRRAIELDPDDLGNYSALGGFYFAHGRYAEAAGIYGRMAQHPGASASAWNGQGAAFYMMGQFDRAAQAYREVVAREPSAAAWSNIGTAYFFNGQFADAAVTYREAIALAPENPVWWGNLGDALQQIDGGGQEAQLAYRKAADLAAQLLPANPEDGELLTNLAHYQSRLGDDERASQYLARALFAAPDDVYAHYYAALVHLEAGRRQQALDEISRSVELGYPVALLAPDPQFADLRNDQSFQGLIDQPGGGK